MYAVACTFQTFGLVAAASVGLEQGCNLQGCCVIPPIHRGLFQRRLAFIKIYAFLCPLSALLVLGVTIMRVVTHFVFKVCRSISCIFQLSLTIFLSLI